MRGSVSLLVAVLVLWRRSTSGERYGILVKRKMQWLSVENVTVIVNYAFPDSHCCNVHLNSDLTEEEHLVFRLFTSAYRGEYFVGVSSYDCSDYLLIAAQDRQIIKLMQRLPAKSTARILAFVGTELDKRSLLLNAAIYETSSMNLVCPNGIYILSENYLENRVFKKVSRFDKLKGRIRTINMQARELQVATVFNPPLCFLNTTVEKTINGISAKVFLMNNSREMDGIELHLFFTIAKRLNFTFTLRKPTGPYNHGRKYNATAWSGGMIGQLFRKEVHIAFSNVWLIYDNYEFVNLTHPWTQIFIRFLVPRPQSYTSFWALTRPFTETVWLLVLVVLGLKSAYICAKARLEPSVPKRFRNVLITCIEMTGRMVGAWLPQIEPELRLQVVLWELAGFVIVSSYCSSLAAMLTNPEYEKRVDTVQQFIEKNFSWGREGTTPQFKDYFDLEDEYAQQMPSRFILETSAEEKTQRALQGNYAVIGKIVGNVYYPEGTISNEALQRLRVMRQSVGQFYTCFAVQPWLLDPINKIMVRLRESGIVLYHLHNVIHRRTSIQLREVFVEYDNFESERAVVLTVNPLGAGFAALIFGLLVASVVFYTELRSAR